MGFPDPDTYNAPFDGPSLMGTAALPTDANRTGEIRLAFTLSGVIALRMLGLFLILPVFMVLAQDVPGFTPALGGLALGVYGLTQAVLQQPFGRLSDRFGRRPVLLAGLGLFAAGGVVAATADSMAALVLGRALQGCGAIAGVAMAFASDFARPERRPLVMAIIGIGIGAAFLLSLASAVPLASRLGLPGLFWLTVAFAFAGMLLIATTPGPRAAAALTVEPGVAADRTVTAPIRFLALSAFVLHAVMTALFVVLPGRLVEVYGLPLASHWRLYLPAMAASALIALPVAAWAGRQGRSRHLLPWSFAVLGGALLLLRLPSETAWLAASLGVYFTGFNVVEALLPSLVAQWSEGAGRGRRLGFYSTFQFLGAFAGGAGGGLLLARVGSASALLGAAVLCLGWSLLTVACLRRYFPTGRPK